MPAGRTSARGSPPATANGCGRTYVSAAPACSTASRSGPTAPQACQNRSREKVLMRGPRGRRGGAVRGYCTAPAPADSPAPRSIPSERAGLLPAGARAARQEPRPPKLSERTHPDTIRDNALFKNLTVRTENDTVPPACDQRGGGDDARDFTNQGRSRGP